MYRVNYGNGQVSETFGSKKAALAHIAMQGLYQKHMFVQCRMDGEWFFSGSYIPC